MLRVLITTMALWALSLSPGLCLAGALEHPCTSCPEEAFCAHEEACVDDPCSDVLLRPDASLGANDEPAAVAHVATPLVGSDRGERQMSRRNAPALPVENLPRPESDLPLII